MDSIRSMIKSGNRSFRFRDEFMKGLPPKTVNAARMAWNDHKEDFDADEDEVPEYISQGKLIPRPKRQLGIRAPQEMDPVTDGRSDHNDKRFSDLLNGINGWRSFNDRKAAEAEEREKAAAKRKELEELNSLLETKYRY